MVELVRALSEEGIRGRIADMEAFAAKSPVLLLVHEPSGTPMEVSLAWLQSEREAVSHRRAGARGRHPAGRAAGGPRHLRDGRVARSGPGGHGAAPLTPLDGEEERRLRVVSVDLRRDFALELERGVPRQNGCLDHSQESIRFRTTPAGPGREGAVVAGPRDLPQRSTGSHGLSRGRLQTTYRRRSSRTTRPRSHPADTARQTAVACTGCPRIP